MKTPAVKTPVTPVITLLSRGLELVPMEAPAPKERESFPYGKEALQARGFDVWAGR